MRGFISRVCLAVALALGLSTSTKAKEEPSIFKWEEVEDFSDEYYWHDSNYVLLEEIKDVKKEQTLPNREVSFYFNNLLTNFEAGTYFLNSMHEVKSYGLNQIVSQAKNRKISRVGIVTIDFLLSSFLKFLSQEFGYIREGKKYGDFNVSLNFRKNGLLRKQFNYYPTTDEYLNYISGGFNNNEYDSYLLYKNSTNELTFDKAMSFLVTKLANLDNYFSFRFEEYKKAGKVYVDTLKLKGINLSDNDFFTQSILADLFSLHTWYSIIAVKNYISNDNKIYQVPMLKLGRVELTPPLINHYLTNRGGFYNLTSIINPNSKHSLELSLGTSADFIGAGEVDVFRTGLKYNNLLSNKLKLSPFLALTSNKKTRSNNFSYGIEAKLKLLKNTSLLFKTEYNKNDILENEIKGKNNGWSTSFGISIKF